MMEKQLKQRLIGATVLVGLGVIFIPMLLDSSEVPKSRMEIPARSDDGFTSRVIPMEKQPIDTQGIKQEGPLQQEARLEPKSDSVVSAERMKEEAAEAVSPPQESPKLSSDPPPPLLPPAPASEQAGASGWAIQLASFSSEGKAAALKTRLQQHGYSVFVEKTRVKQDKLYRVRIGPVPQAQAKALQVKLEKDINLKGIVIRYP
jgi:DedD protein